MSLIRLGLKSKVKIPWALPGNAWSVMAGLILPMLAGTAIGHPLGAFIMAFCLRTTLILNMAFFVNSFARMVGNKGFDAHVSAGDSGFLALFTNGEGYHNFHHKFPNDYRNGHLWHHWDPSKWVIYGLARLGLVEDVKRTPDAKILEVMQAVRAAPVSA